eukprot:TRINITY_DN2829_c0_g1_i1.p1 TRINITY_DN2829_c0_g1~~TRINITY_DN2829_c0_g1_i1.p1  ORF type:complete len:1138 (-),score=314.68 TRINITY_DN2829_c0_g1_i1:42-3455(-)
MTSVFDSTKTKDRNSALKSSKDLNWSQFGNLFTSSNVFSTSKGSQRLSNNEGKKLSVKKDTSTENKMLVNATKLHTTPQPQTPPQPIYQFHESNENSDEFEAIEPNQNSIIAFSTDQITPNSLTILSPSNTRSKQREKEFHDKLDARTKKSDEKLVNLTNRVDQLFKRLTILTKERDELKFRLSMSEKSLIEKNKEVEKAMNKATSSISRLNEIESVFNVVEDRAISAEARVESLLEQNAEFITQSRTTEELLRNKISEAHHRIELLNEENRDLGDLVVEGESAITELEQMREEFAEIKNNHVQLKNINDLSGYDVDGLLWRCVESEKTRVEDSVTIQELHDKLTAATKKVEKMDEHYVLFEEKAQKYEEMLDERDAARSYSAELLNQLHRTDKNLRIASQELERLINVESDFEKKRNEYSKLINEFETQKLALETVNGEIVRMTKELEELNIAYEGLQMNSEQERDRLNEQLSSLNDTCSRLQEENKTLDDNCKQLNIDLNQERSKASGLEKSNDHLSNRLEEALQQISLSSEKAGILQGSLESIKNEAEKVPKLEEDLNQMKIELHLSKQNEKNALENTNSTLLKVNELQTEVETLKRTAEVLDNENRLLKEELHEHKDVEKQLEGMYEEAEQIINDQKEQLEVFARSSEALEKLEQMREENFELKKKNKELKQVINDFNAEETKMKMNKLIEEVASLKEKELSFEETTQNYFAKERKLKIEIKELTERNSNLVAGHQKLSRDYEQIEQNFALKETKISSALKKLTGKITSLERENDLLNKALIKAKEDLVQSVNISKEESDLSTPKASTPSLDNKSKQFVKQRMTHLKEERDSFMKNANELKTLVSVQEQTIQELQDKLAKLRNTNTKKMKYSGSTNIRVPSQIFKLVDQMNPSLLVKIGEILSVSGTGPNIVRPIAGKLCRIVLECEHREKEKAKLAKSLLNNIINLSNTNISEDERLALQRLSAKLMDYADETLSADISSISAVKQDFASLLQSVCLRLVEVRNNLISIGNIETVDVEEVETIDNEKNNPGQKLYQELKLMDDVLSRRFVKLCKRIIDTESTLADLDGRIEIFEEKFKIERKSKTMFSSNFFTFKKYVVSQLSQILDNDLDEIKNQCSGLLVGIQSWQLNEI